MYLLHKCDKAISPSLQICTNLTNTSDMLLLFVKYVIKVSNAHKFWQLRWHSGIGVYCLTIGLALCLIPFPLYHAQDYTSIIDLNL